jgi:hypothetical protein
MDSAATTNQSTSANQTTGSTQGATVAPSQSGSTKGRTSQRQATGASQSSQTNPDQYVAPSASTGVESSAQFRGNHNTIYMDSQATTNQSTTANQTTGSTQGMNVQPSQNRAAQGVPGMGAVPGVSGNVSGAAGASAGGTSAAAGGSVGSNVDMSDGPGKRGKGKAKGHEKQSNYDKQKPGN